MKGKGYLMLNQTTDVLYTRAHGRGQRGLLWSALTGRSRHLLALGEIKATCSIHTCGGAEKRTVPISQIRGSESRCTDFDREFNPLQEHNKGRWQRVAGARERGRALPPVELVQIGGLYFVQDGHHRISVARALGQRNIEARVAVWQVSGPLPWEMETRANPVYAISGWPLGRGWEQASSSGNLYAERRKAIRAQRRLYRPHLAGGWSAGVEGLGAARPHGRSGSRSETGQAIGLYRAVDRQVD